MSGAPSLPDRAKPIAALTLAALAGWLFSLLNSPLPWLIGPMLTVAAAQMLGADLHVPRGLRFGGQWIVGGAIGLYFTPPVLAMLPSLLPWIILGLAASILLSMLAAKVLAHYAGIDPVTALYASFLGGAAEMANLAERSGALVDRVAAAQSVRIILVVVLIPFAFRWADLHGADSYATASLVFDARGFALLMGVTCAAGLVCHLLRMPNAWLVGPVFASIALNAAGHASSIMPVALVDVAQVLIGCSLGTKFSREFFHAAPRFMLVSTLCSAAVLLGSSLGALILGWLANLPAPTLILGMAPGGIAEMSLTAGLLQLGVPVVVAFQLTRLLVVVSSASLMHRLAMRWLLR